MYNLSITFNVMSALRKTACVDLFYFHNIKMCCLKAMSSLAGMNPPMMRTNHPKSCFKRSPLMRWLKNCPIKDTNYRQG